jgi:trans-aconitate methyltransferase
MNENWYDIWKRKGLTPTGDSLLSKLMAADGFDAFGSLSEAAWIGYAETIGKKLEIGPRSTLYEVGCGSGAFLYPFYSNGVTVAGSDYSAGLIEAACVAMPNASLEVADAINLGATEKFDVVLSNGVFLYFSDLSFAEAVLVKMLEKASRKVSILDVPDLNRRDQSIELRRGHLGPDEYERRYGNLPHLYYPRGWFSEVLQDHPVQIEIEDQYSPGYLHNAFRYNVFITK